ncbi:hypothetical protein F2Q68_00025601 [Brassica cretica]|uniref:CASP-like protein n=1 Tax=Brassica cretica TaxID=69181 RepID=A0A8S9IIX8_BRACR|nr:hypothetical protein F2Q68_00025601 [Brassica cretica]
MASVMLLFVVFVFDLIAFGLAVAAEQRRTTWQVVNESRDSSYCVYEKDIATGLGIGSFLILLASQLFMMVASRCLCCGRALTPRSVQNSYHTKYRVYLGNTAPSCRSVRKGVFGAGAAFIILTGIVSELYYVCLTRAKDFEVPKDPGIRMSSL